MDVLVEKWHLFNYKHLEKKCDQYVDYNTINMNNTLQSKNILLAMFHTEM